MELLIQASALSELASSIEPEYAARLLTIIKAERQTKVKGAFGSGSRLLSGRELEVLGLLEARLSDRQIAKKLYISLSTAKTHVRHIFEKLNVQNRTEALLRARELKLI